MIDRPHAPAARSAHGLTIPSRLRRALVSLMAVTMLGACGQGAAPVVSGPVPASALPAETDPSPIASAAATMGVQEVAVAAFVDAVTSGDLSYRITFSGHASGSVDLVPVKGAMNVSGEDFASSFTYDFSAEYAGLGDTKVQVRGVEGKGWTRRDGGDWKAIKGYDVEDSYVPFKAVSSTEDVTHLGSVEVDGATLYRISIPGALLIHPTTIPYNVKGEKIDQTTLELLIDEDGRPVQGTWALRGQARVGEGVGQLQRIVYDLDLAFSKVGEELTIKKP